MIWRRPKIQTTAQAEAKVKEALNEMRRLVDDLQSLGRELERVTHRKELNG